MPSHDNSKAAAVRTFLFADMRGYARFVVEHGDATAVKVVEKFGLIVNSAVIKHHGTIIGKAGDEAIAVFGSARDAIRAGVQLQESYSDEAKGDPELPQVGIGLDTGEAVPLGDTFIGAALNLASRLCKLAGPQEILASEGVIHVVGKLEDVDFVERGFTQLKGFNDPVHIYQVKKRSKASASAVPRETDSTASRGLVAVTLPIGAFLGALPSTELVSRDSELKRLLVAADAVEAGTGRLVLISGEPGVGKTRLAQEAMLTVRNRRFLVTTGRCYEQQKSVPFYPFIDALSGAYASCPPPVRAAVASRWPYLFRLLPDSSPEALSPAPSTPEEEQRLFRAVTGFLQEVCKELPVAIFLDDLHLADGSSLELLQHLARNSRGTRLLIVGTFREMEFGRQHPLEAALRDLGREDLVERVSLHRLEPDGTSELIAETLGEATVPVGIVKMVHKLAEGNPFFTLHLVRYFVERGDVFRENGKWVHRPSSGIVVPDSVRSVIEHRLTRLGVNTQELLREASVLGQTFTFERIAALPGRKEDEVESALEEALKSGLVIETQHEGYSFDHALTQQALYADLPAHKRHRLHLAVAEAMERLPESERSMLNSELVWHFVEADEEVRAIPYAIAGGDRATLVFAFKEADRQYSSAMEIAGRAKDPKGESSALMRRAKLRLDTFRGKEAARDYERLLEMALKQDDRPQELSARLGLAGAYYVEALDETESDVISRSRAMAESAYDLARSLGDKQAMIRALLSTKWLEDFWPDYAERWHRNAREARALSREVGNPELILESELMTWRLGSRSESERLAGRLVQELRMKKDPLRLNRLYFGMMWAYLDWGEYERAVETCEAAIRLADEIEVPPVQYPTLMALALVKLGRYGEAWDSLQREVTDDAHPFGRAMQTLGIAEYQWGLLDFAEAAAACRDLNKRAGLLGRAWMTRWAGELMVRSLARTGILNEATRLEIRKQLDNLGEQTPHEVMAEVLLAEAKPEAALKEAIALAKEARAGEHSAQLLAAFELQARALLNIGRPKEALGVLEEGDRLARSMRALPAMWTLLSLRSKALQATGDSERARRSLIDSALIVRQIGETVRGPEERAKFFASPSVAAVLGGRE
ncbi:MAG: AAA family ATPase [Thaumarchaeota archaeon]|nr:AAA family ATPase [Nitrososphaerota archaeon]